MKLIECAYYKRACDHNNCVFAFSCKEECYFVFKRDSEAYNEEHREIEGLENELYSKDIEINNLEGEIEDLQNEMCTLENENDNLTTLCKDLLGYLKSVKHWEELLDIIECYDLDLSTLSKLRKGIEVYEIN